MVKSRYPSTMPSQPPTDPTICSDEPPKPADRRRTGRSVGRAGAWLVGLGLGLSILLLPGFGSLRADPQADDSQNVDPQDHEAGAPDNGTAESADPREVELERIRQEIGRLQRRLVDVRRQESGLEDELQRVELELELQQAELDEATAALELAEARMTSAEIKVGELEVALEAIRGDLERRLVGLYRLGGQGYFRLFFALGPDQELLPAIRQLRFLAHRDRDTFDRFETTRDQLERQRLVWSSQREEAERWRQREVERRDALVVLQRRHERTLAKVAAERRRLAERTHELQDKEKKLGRLISSLVTDDGGDVLSGTPISEFRGVLDWPARGEVVGEFGPRRDPRYRTEVPHNGIDLETPGGVEVQAIFPGQVLYSAPFEGYGPMVVVHHPGRVFTLYAGLQELRVEKGDVLSLGDVVGRSGDTLYFEVRVENQPENPRLWLR